ncbi:multidrug resistance protein, MFS family [Legionella busanensis]|uniref:Multidrug resistance protein, MFS family n=1 Tax=Legionella busanensis TaxID=190655 RepID=A0A378KB23_9GAMM|nr:MFS transporter [Legionella busanensis]STX81530.1 multidrug resistance protein, MFS family [Legionella busanensis]
MSFIKQYLYSYINLNTKCKLYLLFYMLQSISAGVSFFIAIFLNEYLLLTTDTISLIVGCFVLGNLLGSWLTSKLLDKSNPFKLSGISLILQAICFFAICSTTSTWLITVIMLILGMASYVYVICNDYLITALAGKMESERALAISLLNVSSNIGLGIGGVVVSYLSKANPIYMFVMIGTILIISALFYFLDSSDKVHIKKVNHDEGRSKANQNLYRLSLGIIFLLGLIFAQQRVGYSLFLTKYYGDSGASFIFMLNSFLIIFLLPTVTKNAIKKNQVLSMGLGVFFLGGGMFLLSMASSAYWLVIVVCLITTLGEMLGTTLSQLLCFQYVSIEKRGKAMGHYKFLYAFGTIIGTLTGGKIQVVFGENYIWFFCGIIGCLSLILCSRVNRRQFRPQLLTA